ncbi:hypothetical protein [Achromobacter xylosoxidans]|uniref:hypothetical protein n=1 Tax=Alcaligenes xylosoxydans xylosoxydans TaxID=85698 RepID=UPI0003D5CAAA|nr:hypothetical protein [Achromobacter xylosoxidans]AHC48242.1 phage-related hypothetical protein [Achromobacter xylosoxidans NBRC 15126 = ATCC 27061]QKQ52602.1 hypothetical protein FOC83_06320 [Achromobacter xylosoxidans]QPR92515.1 hypothetical protein I6G72_17710 [Achromobacter xylosoxidans]UON42194.1 hypothetical protein IUJ48_08825 [Achromobacter xylosoxidans]CKH74657.1 Uncharacterised protein [Achromobacter xylosoxidans]
MDLKKIIDTGIRPGLALLPARMDTAEARVMLLAIGLQESRFTHRQQIGGPARGFWQFEKGTRASRGGVWGVFLHAASKSHLAALCKARSVVCDPDAIYAALEYDDVLAAGVARLLLWTDPKALPAIGDVDTGWAQYLRTWRPGKPHPKTWPALYAQAMAAVEI